MNRRLFLSLVFILVVGCNNPTPPVVPPVTPPVPTPSDVSQALLDAHNKIRSSRGLALLKSNPLLQKAADSHAGFMASVGQMAHEGIGDGTPWTRIQATGYHYSTAGENIAWNATEVVSVMNLWENSPGHLANILGNYSDAGFAVAMSKDNSLYYCVDFGMPSELKSIKSLEKSSSTSITIGDK